MLQRNMNFVNKTKYTQKNINSLINNIKSSILFSD